MNSEPKRALRAHIKTLLASYGDEQLLALSRSLMERVLSHPRVQRAATLLLYHSLPDEPCTHELIRQLHAQGRHVILPKVVSPTLMTLHPYQGEDTLAPGAYGILEPNTPAIDAHELSHARPQAVALVPGIAFDAHGNRLGRGKGYYDRLLGTVSTYNIGICFPFQMVDTIPTGQYDVPMNEVITTNPL